MEYDTKIAEGNEKGEDVSLWQYGAGELEKFGDSNALRRQSYKNAYIQFFFWGLIATPIFCAMMSWIYMGFKKNKR